MKELIEQIKELIDTVSSQTHDDGVLREYRIGYIDGLKNALMLLKLHIEKLS